jgi:hypothetical protein
VLASGINSKLSRLAALAAGDRMMRRQQLFLKQQ